MLLGHTLQRRPSASALTAVAGTKPYFCRVCSAPEARQGGMCLAHGSADEGGPSAGMPPVRPGDTTLSLSELCAEADPFAATEAAAMLAPMLRELAAIHGTGRSHGQLSMTAVTIRVCEPDEGTVLHTVHLAFTEEEGAQRPLRCALCMPPEERALSGTSSQAGDIWSVGVIALQMLLGRQCPFAASGACCGGFVDRCSGDMPVLPTGISFECIDFLLDCLALLPAHRPSAAELMESPFLRPFALAPATRTRREGSPTKTESLPTYSTADRGGGAGGDVDALLPLMHEMLISHDLRTRPPPCRPRGVPSLSSSSLGANICFESPSHTCRACPCKVDGGRAPPGPAHSAPGHCAQCGGCAATGEAVRGGGIHPGFGERRVRSESSTITSPLRLRAPGPIKRKSCRIAARGVHGQGEGWVGGSMRDSDALHAPARKRVKPCVSPQKSQHQVHHAYWMQGVLSVSAWEATAASAKNFAAAVSTVTSLTAVTPTSPSSSVTSSPEQAPMPFPTDLPLPPLEI